jgi:hypothetical protein
MITEENTPALFRRRERVKGIAASEESGGNAIMAILALQA